MKLNYELKIFERTSGSESKDKKVYLRFSSYEGAMDYANKHSYLLAHNEYFEVVKGDNV